MVGRHSPFPGVTAWYQAWKPDPSTLLSETKATRRRLALVLSVGGGTFPHTLQEARLGAMEAQSSGPARPLSSSPEPVAMWSKGAISFPGELWLS